MLGTLEWIARPCICGIGCLRLRGPGDAAFARKRAEQWPTSSWNGFAGQAAQAWESTTAEFKSAEGREVFVQGLKNTPG